MYKKAMNIAADLGIIANGSLSTSWSAMGHKALALVLIGVETNTAIHPSELSSPKLDNL